MAKTMTTTIQGLVKHRVHPESWVITQDGDNRNYISCMVGDDLCLISTARGQSKVYKHIATAIKDIRLVEHTPTITIHQMG